MIEPMRLRLSILFVSFLMAISMPSLGGSCINSLRNLMEQKMLKQEKNLKLGPQTIEMSSGVQIEGDLATLKKDQNQKPYYYGTKGPTRLMLKGETISGQGHGQHPHGFGSPVGEVVGSPKRLEDLKDSELKQIGIGPESDFTYTSGVHVVGKLTKVTRSEFGKIVILTFENATVKDADGSILFDPAWGTYDMAVGSALFSVQSVQSN